MSRESAARKARLAAQVDPEPTKMQSVVVDADGEQWIKGRTWWRCLAKVDGIRITNVAKLHWSDMVAMYGPVRVLRIGPRPRR